MLETLLLILIVGPVLSGIAIFLLRPALLRTPLVLVTAVVVAGAGACLALGGPFVLNEYTVYGLSMDTAAMVLDFFLLAVVLFYGLKHKNLLVILLGLAQAGLLAWVEFSLLEHGAEYPRLYGDTLGLALALVVSVVGSLICVYAIPYMRKHEEHLHLKRSRQPGFFAVLVLFLGAMNGLVLTNDLMHFYLFFEATTLCSFLLIGHDKTEIATKNALTALWMNCLGGLALLVGIAWLYKETGTLEMQKVITLAPFAKNALWIPLALLCVAAFVKSAQPPFMKWLTGAMVAPTPTSALLHSSTMVKAGVYLLLRFAPALHNTFLTECVAVFGAFTFLAGAALALGQSNGKKILAYSTISNLGLIFVCAGLNTPLAMLAGIFLIMFHALSKGLLFLCVGAVEQRIGSRDIEDMRGLFSRMPWISAIMVLGMLTMILPPFGMLLGKWVVIEAAGHNLLVLVMLALGSSVTVAYWARWAGSLLGGAPEEGEPEKQPLLTIWPLGLLALGAVALSAATPWLYSNLIIPVVQVFNTIPDAETFLPPFQRESGILFSDTSMFLVHPLFIVALPALFFALRSRSRAKSCKRVAPYMAGAQTATPGEYTGPMDTPAKAVSGNYYLDALFGEKRLMAWINLYALLLLAIFFAGRAFV